MRRKLIFRAPCWKSGRHPPFSKSQRAGSSWEELRIGSISMSETAAKANKQLQKSVEDSALPPAVVNAIKRGWSVIPVRRDKTPWLNSWKQYQTSRATLEQAERWQAEFNPGAWAVVTGKISDMVVLDFDGECPLLCQGSTRAAFHLRRNRRQRLDCHPNPFPALRRLAKTAEGQQSEGAIRR